MLAIAYDRDDALSKAKEELNAALCTDDTPSEAGLKLFANAFSTATFTCQDGKVTAENYDKQDQVLADDSFKDVLQQLLSQSADASAPVMQYRLPEASRPAIHFLLEIAKWATLQRLLDSVLLLLEMVAEAAVITELAAVYEFMEPALLALKQGGVLKLTVMLRICNTMQRRLSKSTDVLLRGRISLFMSRLFLVTERSGLNITGLVNTSHSIHLEDVKAGDVDSGGEPIDPKLYSTFWGLQHYFQHMPEVREADTFVKVVADIGLVLDAFGRRDVTVAASGPSALGAEGSELPTPKYLSSSKLFGLQLRDATLRRNFLVQCLILLQFLRTPNRPWVDPALKPRQQEDLVTLEAQIYAQLERTPEDGKGFAAAIRGVLGEEAAWVRWKYPEPVGSEIPRGCSDFAKADVPALKRRRVEGLTRSQALEAAVQQPKNAMDGLRVEDRKGKWNHIRDVFGDIIEDMEPGIDEQYKRKNDERHSEKVYAWTCYRLLARHSLDTYVKPDAQEDLENAARDIFPDIAAKFPKPEPKKAEGVKKEDE